MQPAPVSDSFWVLVWWAGMSTVAVVNLALWIFSRHQFQERRGQLDPRHALLRHRHLVLSGIYTVICAFRSVMPRADVQRICLVDSWFSTILVGRAVATVAEVSFVAQWALLLREYGQDARSPVATALSKLLVPLILFAETCSWYAVLTSNYLGNTLEESTWTLTATLMMVGMAALWARAQGAARRFLRVAIVSCAGYVAFMCTVDVPMYFTRWRADEHAGRAYFTLSAGLRDVATRWVPTRSLADWHGELAWMALYFSIAVWMSLYMTHAPRWARDA